jgi:hypothetical protein
MIRGLMPYLYIYMPHAAEHIHNAKFLKKPRGSEETEVNSGIIAIQCRKLTSRPMRRMDQSNARSKPTSTLRSSHRCRLDGFGARSQISGSRFRDLCI